jgi:hypothetical protein
VLFKDGDVDQIIDGQLSLKECIWGIFEPILTQETQSTRRKFCRSATLSTKSHWVFLRLNPDLRCDRPAHRPVRKHSALVCIISHML